MMIIGCDLHTRYQQVALGDAAKIRAAVVASRRRIRAMRCIYSICCAKALFQDLAGGCRPFLGFDLSSQTESRVPVPSTSLRASFAFVCEGGNTLPMLQTAKDLLSHMHCRSRPLLRKNGHPCPSVSAKIKHKARPSPNNRFPAHRDACQAGIRRC